MEIRITKWVYKSSDFNKPWRFVWWNKDYLNLYRW